MAGWKERVNGKIDFEIYEFIFETASQIFKEIRKTSKNFPKEKVYLADLLCRYSKLVCTDLEEAWRMKERRNAFFDKLSDAAQAASKTQDLLKFASKNSYIDGKFFERIDAKYENIFEDIFSVFCNGRKMINHPKRSVKQRFAYKGIVSVAEQFQT